MWKLLTLCYLLLTMSSNAQRNQPIITPSPALLNTQYLDLSISPIPKLHVNISGFEIIDNRYDKSKSGFYPVYKRAPKTLLIKPDFSVWMKKLLDQRFEISTEADRKLVAVIQKFWFTSEADQKFTVFRQNLQSVLYYNLELFSHKEGLFYPLKRIEGSCKVYFTDAGSYSMLADSFFSRLATEIDKLSFDKFEKNPNPVTEELMQEYLDKKLSRVNIAQAPPRGVYANYKDFLLQKVMADSVLVEMQYDYSGKNPISCYVEMIRNGMTQSCNRAWGYFDGRDLYVNTSNGLFVRLRSSDNQYVLADLQQIAYKSKKKGLVNYEVSVAESQYDIIKDFAKTYHLFYQLDFDTGKLY